MVQPYEELLLEIPWILFPLPWHKACGLDLFFQDFGTYGTTYLFGWARGTVVSTPWPPDTIWGWGRLIYLHESHDPLPIAAALYPAQLQDIARSQFGAIQISHLSRIARLADWFRYPCG